MSVYTILTGVGSCRIGWRWDGALPAQFQATCTSAGQTPVVIGINKNLRTATLTGLKTGIIWSIELNSINPNTYIGTTSSGIVLPHGADGTDSTAGDPASSMRTVSWTGGSNNLGDWDWVITVPFSLNNPGEFVVDGSVFSTSIGPFAPNTVFGTGDIAIHSRNTGGNGPSLGFAAMGTAAESAAPDIEDVSLDSTGIPISIDDPEVDPGVFGEAYECEKYIEISWIDSSAYEVDTWSIYLEDVLIETFDRWEKMGDYLVWRPDLTVGVHWYRLDVTAFSSGDFPLTIRLRGTNDSGYSEATKSVSPACDSNNLLSLRMSNGLEDTEASGYGIFAGNESRIENLLDISELAFASSGDEDLYGRKNPTGLASGLDVVITYEVGAVFTVPRSDAAVKADAGYSDIRQRSYGAGESDIHMILQNKSETRRLILGKQAERLSLVSDPLMMSLSDPDVTLSLKEDGMLVLSDNFGSLKITDGYDVGRIEFDTENKGSILLTETEQVPVSYIGEKL